MAGYIYRNTLIDIDDELQNYVKKYVRAMEDVPKKIARSETRKAVTRASKFFKQEVQLAAPVGKTKALSKKIYRATKFKRYGRAFEARIGYDKNKTPHAFIIEDGTKNRKTKSGANRGNVTARKFFSNTTRRLGYRLGDSLIKELRTAHENAMRRALD